MKIHSITLKNFLCYYSNNKIIFKDGLNLVLGSNGYGKSKLYDAFQWVFKDGITDDLIHGDERNPGNIKKTENLKRTLISDKALAETKNTEIVSCEVIIEVSYSEHIHYQLKRKYSVQRISNVEWKEPVTSTFELFKKDVTSYITISDEYEKDRILETLIPTGVRPYVWFQGERGVNNIIDISSAKSLRTVIKQLSDIEIWEDYIDIAKKLASDVKKEYELAIKTSKSYNDNVEKLLEDKNYLESQLTQKEQLLTETEDRLTKLTKKRELLIANLSTAQKIEKERLKKDNKISHLIEVNRKIDFFYSTFPQNLFKKYWLLMNTDNLLNKYAEKYNNYQKLVIDRQVSILASEKINSLPQGVPEPVHVNNMLEDEHCYVCDRPARKGTPEYAAIEKKIDTSRNDKENKKDIEKQLRLFLNSGYILSDKFKNTEEDITNIIEEKDSLVERRKDLEADIAAIENEIQNEINNSGIDQATDIINSFEEAEDDIRKCSQNLGKLQGEIERIKGSLQSNSFNISRLTKGEIKPDLEEKKKLTEDLVDSTIRIKESQYSELIKLLEKKSNEHYERINKPTGAFYGKIRFTETSNDGYRPEIIDDTQKKVSNLNTSQTSSLKLAIIMAIITANQSIDNAARYPLISDAPISDFDALKSKSFLVEVANTFSQSIIIVKDYLKEEANSSNRYSLDIERLQELQELLKTNSKLLNIVHLNIPEGLVVTNRETLSIDIKQIGAI